MVHVGVRNSLQLWFVSIEESAAVLAFRLKITCQGLSVVFFCTVSQNKNGRECRNLDCIADPILSFIPQEQINPTRLPSNDLFTLQMSCTVSCMTLSTDGSC